MYKPVKKLCLLLVLCVIVSCMSPAAFAGRVESEVDSSAYVSADQNSVKETVADDSYEIYQREEIIETLYAEEAACFFESVMSRESPTGDGKSELALIQSIFDCNINISAVDKTLDKATGENHTKFISEDRTEISVSEDGDIYRISAVFGDSATNEVSSTEKISKLSIKEMENCCLALMPTLYHLFDIDEQYTLAETYDFDDDYVFFTFEKSYGSGITNPLESINVVLNKNSLKVTVAVKFDSAPNAVAPEISYDKALAIANAYSSRDVIYDSANLTYISDRVYNTNIHQYDDDICYLVYAVSSSGENAILYVDALSGEYVGRDIVMSETGFAVAIQESANSSAYNYNSDLDDYTATEIARFNSWRIDKMTWAASAMRRLGYSATSSSYTTSAMITDVQDYLSALGDEYAFYFSGHGNTTILGFKRNGWIRTTDVDGNWHFVFLDACQTAVDTGWADAFNINGYVNRAYLGWNGNIRWDNGYLFAEEFWPLINGTNTVRQAAVDAAALVPGSGTTPIKFYGDTSYTGEAWS